MLAAHDAASEGTEDVWTDTALDARRGREEGALLILCILSPTQFFLLLCNKYFALSQPQCQLETWHYKIARKTLKKTGGGLAPLMLLRWRRRELWPVKASTPGYAAEPQNPRDVPSAGRRGATTVHTERAIPWLHASESTGPLQFQYFYLLSHPAIEIPQKFK